MTEGYFPGSRQPISLPSSGRDVLDGLTGKVFTVRGAEVELFTIGQVAQALNRSAQTIRGWEKDGVIPAATFTKPGAGGDVRGRRRLYSRQQVEALVTAAEATKILHDTTRRIGSTSFTDRVFAAFKELAGK